MGQTKGKEVKRKRPQPTSGGPSSSSRPAVRSSAVNDAVLHTAGSPVGGPQHTDPNRLGIANNGSISSRTSVNSHAGVQSPLSAQGRMFPIVLRYVGKDVGGLIKVEKPVYVAVEAMNWQPLPMTPSTDSFYALLELPPGNHNYRFIVDGKEMIDATQTLAPSGQEQVMPASITAASATVAEPGAGATPSVPLPAPTPAKDGKPANTIFLNDVLLTTKEDDDIMDNGNGWGQDAIMFEESRKYPPIVPLHLRYTPLNTPPTLVRCAKNGRMEVMGDDTTMEESIRVRPENLPLPLSVTINHVYFQRREEHAVMGVTTRYCNKFTTVVYYTRLPPVSQ